MTSSLQVHTLDDLLNVVEAAPQPISVLFGSPMSWDAGGGVPGVSDIIQFIRGAIGSRPRINAAPFEAKIAGLSGPAAYQAAMSWAQANLTQDAVNDVIHKAVAKARLPTAKDKFEEDGDPADWYIPAGTRQLAALLTSDPIRFAGPALTTNFDPLLSLAVQQAGGDPRLHILDADGRLPLHVERRSGATDIVHLHGFWREVDTLHTPAQLSARRPQLHESLKRLLRERTLLVVAYAGWDDAFTNALADVLNDSQSKINVLWCFRENNPHIIAGDYSHLLDRVHAAIGRGRFLAYGGIDCHSVFERILLARATPHRPASRVKAPPGWEVVDETLLATIPPLSPGEVLRFFNGSNSSLRHGPCPHIPAREQVETATRQILCRPPGTCFIQRIASAAGEGKSTLFHQAVVRLAKEGSLNVIHRTEEGLSLPVKFVLDLDPHANWLIAVDNAADLSSSVRDCLSALQSAGKTNVGFLLSARDTDWIRSKYSELGLERWAIELPLVRLRGISELDAEAIVASWTEAGPEGLGELQRISPDLRSKRLKNFVRDAGAVVGEGSFVGGLLQVRFSESGLRAHLRELLAKLNGVPVLGSSATLGDALVYVSCCHGAGIAGINEVTLADLTDVARAFVQTRVVRPLGDEVGATRSRGHVYTRHSAVASALLVEADLLGIDLAEYWHALVRQTVAVGREGIAGDTHGDVIHAGPRLLETLPTQLPLPRREEIALSAARAAVEYQIDWLGCVVNLGQTFRKARSARDGADLFQNRIGSIRQTVDYQRVVRGYFHEWAVCEANIEKTSMHLRRSILLEALSLSDSFGDLEITDDRLKMSLSGIGVAFGELSKLEDAPTHMRAKRASAWLGRKSNPDQTALTYFDNYDKDCDAAGVARVSGESEALAWFDAGVRIASAKVDTAFVALKVEAKPAFTQLKNKIGRAKGKKS